MQHQQLCHASSVCFAKGNECDVAKSMQPSDGTKMPSGCRAVLA
jgi:hypothetical protein